jgi:hypothetical protein
MSATEIESAIERRIGDVRFDALDLSFGEMMSLYSAGEFCIDPDFQRYFRWTDEQRSRRNHSHPVPREMILC